MEAHPIVTVLLTLLIVGALVQIIRKLCKPKKTMQAFILTREAIDQPLGHVVMGAYTTFVEAQAARNTKIAAYVATVNALRDTAYTQGEGFNEVLTAADVLLLVKITEVTVGV
jgi:hypothetical protein